MVPDTPDVEDVLFGADGVAAGLLRRQDRRRHELDLADRDQGVRAPRSTKQGCDYVDAPVSGGEVGAKAASLTIMVGGVRGGVRAGQAAVRTDGQEHHPGRRRRRRPDHQGRQPDHRRAEHRGGRRGAAVRLQGRRRSGQGAPGADGRLRRLAHPRSARRAHDQAHLRPRLPHRTAPEGPEPGAPGRARDGRLPAQHRDDAGAVQRRRRRSAAKGWDHSGPGPGARAPGRAQGGRRG